MKQIISLCLAVFFIAGIQNSQAQTKEETIQWLNDYGKALSLSGHRFTLSGEIYSTEYTYFSGFDGENLKFTIISDYSKSEGRSVIWKSHYRILPNDILFQDISTLNENKFILKSKIKFS